MSDFEYLRPIIREGLEQIYSWYRKDNPSWLKALFPEMGFAAGQYKSAAAFIPPVSLSGKPVLPVMKPDESFTVTRNEIKEEIHREYRDFSPEYLDSLNLNQMHFLLERYGSNIPAQEDDSVSLFDACKLRCAEVVIRKNNEQAGYPGNKDRLLIHFDISGIQTFIYNITSRGALKNLRARSFFIELLTYHTTERLLKAFTLHTANILVNGGGSVYLLAGRPQNYKRIISEVDSALNSWLLEEFGGKLHVCFAVEECLEQELNTSLGAVLERLAGQIFTSKQQKFRILIRQEC